MISKSAGWCRLISGIGGIGGIGSDRFAMWDWRLPDAVHPAALWPTLLWLFLLFRVRLGGPPLRMMIRRMWRLTYAWLLWFILAEGNHFPHLFFFCVLNQSTWLSWHFQSEFDPSTSQFLFKYDLKLNFKLNWLNYFEDLFKSNEINQMLFNYDWKIECLIELTQSHWWSIQIYLNHSNLIQIWFKIKLLIEFI